MSELRTNRIVPRDGLVSGASGGIIQVVQNVKGLGQVNSGTYGTSEYDIGLNCTITPQRSDSKILINANWPAIQEGAFMINYYLNRGTTHIHEYQLYQGTGSWTVAYPNMMFLDSPATTSAVTYKLQVSSWAGRNFYINRSEQDSGAAWTHGASSSMTAMEVSG